MAMQRHGFTLVELSIVLVILGLLVGGILAGQSLIRASELRSVLTQADQYRTATMAFKDKYFAIPGDFANATTIWGRVGGGTGQCNSPGTDIDLGLPTCNGDGNGRLDVDWEWTRYWEHLATAGLIEGIYSGAQPGGSIMVPGTNVPRGRISNTGWTAVERDIILTTNFFTTSYGNSLQVGTANPSGSTYYPFLTPTEAWNLDTKGDDSKPARGKIIATYPTTCTLAANETSLDADYRLSSTTMQCSLIFRQQF